MFEGIDAAALLAVCNGERRAIPVRLRGEERFIAADEAGLYRDALGAVPPGGLPEAFLEDVPDALVRLVAPLRRHARSVHGAELRVRYGVDAARAARARARAACSCAASCAPGAQAGSASGATYRGPAPPAPRFAGGGAARGDRAGRPARPGGLPADPGRASTATPASGAGQSDRLREVLVPLQGLALPAESWERDVPPRRTGAYSRTWLDSLCASGSSSCGSVPARSGARADATSRCSTLREDAPLIRAATGAPSGAATTGTRRLAAGIPRASAPAARPPTAQSPCFFSDLLAELEMPAEALREALWDLVWAGEVTNDAWAPLRAPRLALARARGRSRGRAPLGVRVASARAPARAFAASAVCRAAWVAHRGDLPRQAPRASRVAHGRRIEAGASQAERLPAGRRRRSPSAGGCSPSCCSSATASSRREQVRAEGIRGGFAMLYDTLCDLETLGVCRVADTLDRGHGRRAVRAAGRRRWPVARRAPCAPTAMPARRGPGASRERRARTPARAGDRRGRPGAGLRLPALPVAEARREAGGAAPRGGPPARMW